MNEVWKPIIGHTNYFISNLGRVRFMHKILNQYDNKKGYLYCNIEQKHYYIHRLVATAFIVNNNKYPCINHKDYNKNNNCVSNLEWCSYKYNNSYSNCNYFGTEAIKKKVYKCNKHNNTIIESYESMAEAARNTVGCSTTGICACCKGRYITHGGYKWKYA